jgi:cytochrome c oxidase assembly protein subunit 15
MAANAFYRLARGSLVLALTVVVLGAWVRLSDAGLGCPDWPGCYGHLDVPRGESAIAAANASYPERPLESHKAWKEMSHRYAAGALGLLVLIMAWLAWRDRRSPGQPVALAVLLAVLILFQALLGMWTVTLKLKPLVVMAHLLGGFATLALLWWLVLSARPQAALPLVARGLRFWSLAALLVLLLQVALGGWTSANYAALACTDFPTCHGQWWPAADFREAFVLWRGVGPSYEYGVLDSAARTAVHLSHRLGALLVLLVVGGLALRLALDTLAALRPLGWVLLGLLLLQLGLGIGNVLLVLPLPVAVAHNGVAALLLLALVTINHRLWRPLRGQISGARQ